jgi:Flp pilus assembly protein TadD
MRIVAAALPVVVPPSARPEACRRPYDCALAQIERRDFAAAIRSLEDELAQSPGSLKALNLMGIALTGAGRIDDADRRFQEALAIDARFTPARKNLAINQVARKQDAAAEANLTRVLTETPDDEVAHLYLGELLYREKRLDSALEHYDKSPSRIAERPEWIRHHAECLLRKSRARDAAAVLSRLPEKDAESQFEAGILLGQAGAFRDAAAFFGRARPGYRDPYRAGYNQVLMLIQAGDATGAIRVGEQMTAQGTAPAELWNLLSQAYLKAGRLKEAYDALRTATRRDPADEENYVDLALICLDHENFDLGLEIVDLGLRQRPESPRLRLHRGVLLAMKGQVGEAEKDFEEARRLAPEGSAAYVALAMAWMQTGQTDKAVEVLRTRARSAKDPVVPYVLGIALVRGGAEPEGAAGTEAVRAFEASIRADPRFPDARSELGKLLMKRGDLARATVELEKAVALDPTDAGAAYVLAQAYQRQGQKTRAEEMARRVSQLRSGNASPDDPDAPLRRMVLRIVREGSAASAPSAAPR